MLQVGTACSIKNYLKVDKIEHLLNNEGTRAPLDIISYFSSESSIPYLDPTDRAWWRKK